MCENESQGRWLDSVITLIYMWHDRWCARITVCCVISLLSKQERNWITKMESENITIYDIMIEENQHSVTGLFLIFL